MFDWVLNKTSVAGLSACKDIFLEICWNFQNILSVEQLWITFSKLFNDFVEALSYFFLKLSLPCLKLFHLSCQKLIFENKTLKNNQFSWNSYHGDRMFAVRYFNSNLRRACSTFKKKQKRAIQRRSNEKEYLQNFRKFLPWMLDLLLKLFPLTSVWLQVATWVCMKSWLDSPLLSSWPPEHLFAIILKLLWGRGCFTGEASTTLNLA